MTVAILDIDGTLVDTNYQHALAWFRAFREHGIVIPIWQLHRHIGMGGDQLVEAVAGATIEAKLGDALRETETERYGEMIGEVVDGWTSSDDVEATKPEPDLVHAALEQADSAELAVMIGDSPWDIEAARNASVDTIAVMTGGLSERELLDAGAISVYESVAELRRAVPDTVLFGGAERD